MRRKFIPLPTQKRLKQLLDYNEDTGELVWKQTIANIRKSKAGRPVGTLHPDGYRQICIDGIQYRTHRIVWMWATGEDPEHLTIGHINHQRDDNRIANLRKANRREQSRYRSNAVGAYLNKITGRYQSLIRIEGHLTHLGYYATLEEASAVYHAKARELYGDFYYDPELHISNTEALVSNSNEE